MPVATFPPAPAFYESSFTGEQEAFEPDPNGSWGARIATGNKIEDPEWSRLGTKTCHLYPQEGSRCNA